MTSEVDNLKTNDILRRRKLRLQQVREQSKSIAKKVRQRTSDEKLRQITKETAQNEQDLLKVQDKFVKELKEYYIQSVKNVGEGHKQAAVAKQKGSPPITDYSKSRGKAAVAELRRKKQDKLDNQKKVLARKLLARDVANEISREKLISVGTKLGSKSSTALASDSNTVLTGGGDDVSKLSKDNNDNEIGLVQPQPPAHCDMATQWDTEETLYEGNPSVPSLPLPIEEDPKETDRTLSKSKKLNLFTLSDDMPNSLRGGLINTSSTYEKVRPSLTMVTEYLQARAMRLREPEPSISNRKPVESLEDIKQTIIKTRSTRNEVSDKQSKISEQSVSKKPSVTMYNHSTRDTRDIPYEESACVVRDRQCNEDAFTQAMRQKTSEATPSNPENNVQSMRSKVAISKLNVEKEYKDTMGFLNSVHKNKAAKPVIKNVYKDDEQQQESHKIHQRRLEQEYKKMVKEHRRHTCKKSNQNKFKTSTTAQKEMDNDFEYSWMPVPESDDNLAIHTIPTTLKEPKNGNSVKFNKVDGYHEYRSRHKHTPPTKDSGHARSNRKVVEAVFVEDIAESSAANETDNGSQGNLTPEPANKLTDSKCNSSDTDRIIIYKIIESKKTKKDKKSSSSHVKVRSQGVSVAEELNHLTSLPNKEVQKCDAVSNVSLEHLKEGLYKTVADKGMTYNTLNYCRVDTEMQGTNGTMPWWTNVSMMAMQNSGDAASPVLQAKQHTCKNASLQWEIGNKPTYERKPTESCNCDHLSASTSATSLKPADKVNPIKTPDGGYIKLVDDDGKEAGKFYIGASGILRDDAYEVVFQVRKKDGKKSEVENTQEKPVEPATENSSKPIESVIEITQEVNKSPVKQSLPTENINISTARPQQPNFAKSQHAISSLDTDQENHNTDNETCLNTLKDSILYKANSKSTQVEPCPKPDTVKSMFTQTSFSSATERQPFVQMSSSASTSYMSPPEKILPIFMNNRHSKPEYCVRRESCGCRTCASKKLGISPIKNFNDFSRNLVTPPNTARSKFGKLGYSESEERQIKKKKKHRCHKVNSQRDTKSKKSSRSKHSLPSNQEVWDDLMLRFTSETSSTQTNNKTKKVGYKSNLNPLIKTYIDHLLSLNSESLKAIEVVNMQCSSVSTPGSSIVEVPYNVGNQKNKDSIEKKISLEQIKKYIEKQLIEKLQERNIMPISKNNLKTKSKQEVNKKNIVPIPKRKQVHKVKSLNISKSILKSMENSSLSKKIIVESCSKPNNSNTSASPTLQCIKNHKQSQCSGKSDKPKYRKEPLRFDQQKQTKRNKIASPIPSVETLVSNIPMRSEVAISSINIASTKTKPQSPVETSTQTNQPVENELNFIKIAESKLHNMEKIANLTEKCTNRLSNLAKVLEEVRKNKCAPYGQGSINDATSSSDNIVEKNIDTNDKVNQNSYMARYDGTDDSDAFPAETRESAGNNFTPLTEILDIGENFVIDQDNVKIKTKPPPALTNYGKYYATPHELSTVVEVDSPMSLIINKNQSPHTSTEEIGNKEGKTKIENLCPNQDSKHSMLDLNQFNQIMLQPFLSIQEYAKDANVVSVDDASNIEEFTIQKEGSVIVATDDVSSLHSDGSLPDVVSELLKRKLIAEPFKFDSGSNGNSTTVSSDSTLSILKIKSTHTDKRKSTHNKENMVESSDSISISSNPDLENAFKKLGMGWASSTLKKTKERLALSSSSNTSSSSLSQFKIKKINPDIPALVSDSISSVKKKHSDKSKNAEQQTEISNSMTVKEFLTTELAKKITFNKKLDRSGQPEEFVSLYETKIPEELKDKLQAARDHSLDLSQNGNRARTSTPVQMFKSMTYHSSSNSNTSNGLFSNADDLSSVKGSNSIRNHSTSDKDDLTIPNYSLKMRKSPEDSKSD